MPLALFFVVRYFAGGIVIGVGATRTGLTLAGAGLLSASICSSRGSRLNTFLMNRSAIRGY